MSDEVSDFLRSVELLKERREEEDEARSRELEEKILQEKKERQARRAERARSISPQKSSPANTPPPAANRVGILPSAADGTSLESPSLGTPGSPRQRAASLLSDAIETAADSSGSPTKENDSPFDSDTKRTSVAPTSPSIGMPSARASLSWQRRPTSQASDRPKSRPLSMFAAENLARGTSGGAESAEPTMSRDQIAQSLAGKDPSWFRQTADAGRGAGAFRKSQVEDQDTVDMPSTRTQLPGMSRGLAAESPSDSPAARPVTPTNKLGSPPPLTGTPRLDPPTGADADGGDAAASNRHSLASPPGRTSPTRPRSPTKGMGGFVQSAMMKRSDSVKRWSVNSPAGLHRADSPRSNGSSSDNAQRPTTPKSNARPKSMLSLPSEPPAPAPASADGKETETEGQASTAQATTPTATEAKEDDGKTSPPTSPSKTMDPRRWSPTKGSSWLEAALSKPESPKAKPVASAPAQPAWMVELNKAKAQKASMELARSASLPPKKPEVKTGGLMRSTPMGANLKPSALSGFPTVPPASTTDKPAIAALRGSLRKAVPTTESPAEAQTDVAAAANTKPDAPPKKDFRANLKPRAPPPEPASTGPTDELKNVFGTLRKTKTQNYVAPDELKDNILRGKAGLHLTGGPLKTERKDEFKEAILKKKDDFRKSQHEGRSVTREPSSASEKSVPEGIAKRLELQRTGTLPKHTPATTEPPLQSPVLTGSNRSSHVSTRSRHDIPAGSDFASKPASDPNKDAAASPFASVTRQKSSEGLGRVGGKVGGLAERFNPALAGLIARGPPAASGPRGSVSSGTSGASQADSEPAGPGPQLTHLTKNRARGPRRKAPASVAPPVEKPQETATAVSQPEKTVFPAGPRKMSFPPPKPEEPAPGAKPEQTQAEKPDIFPKPGRIAAASPEVVSSGRPGEPSRQDLPKPAAEVISLVDSSRRTPREEPKPAGQPITLVGTTPVKTRPRSPTKVHEQVAALAALSQQSPKPESTGEASQPSSPRKLDMKRMSRFLDDQSQPSPVLDPAKSRPSSPVKERSNSLISRPSSPVKERSNSLMSRPSSPVKERSNSMKSRPTSPIKDRFPVLESPFLAKQAGKEQTELKPAPAIRSGFPAGGVGLGLMNAVAAPSPALEKPVGLERPPPLPPKTERPLPAPPAVSSPPTAARGMPSPVRSPGKQASDITGLIDEFFGPERPQRKYTADAAEILMTRRVSTAKVQSQRAQLFQLTSEGKKAAVPTHHERVLFEREMYVCPHTFFDQSGKRVDEVYFWAGDEVPASEVDDAILFAAREARAYGGRLVKLAQGKETSEFLQALGGIVIVRRGSSNKYDSLAPTMLCGRRYLGQVAFDEVDFSPLSLCSGFPYLIAQQGKCYLWKGKGSDVEELGCARLVGMDLALMGELVEVGEGSEPESFWTVFGGGTRPSSADHWRLKPSYDKYCGRLFRASAADKNQITEISPFSQADLHPSHIYILDAFFEMYIVVGARSQHQYAAFRNALDFAQEYAILAAGMEDRPFVPISTVVLEGIPRDLKSVFRKWRDANSPTVMHVSQQAVGGAGIGGGGNRGTGTGTGTGPGPAPSPLKRGRSLRIVPLTQALQALSE